MSKKLEIEKKELYKYYVLDRKSSRVISKIYKCAYSTIDNWIARYGFPKRSLAKSHIKTYRREFSGDSQEKAYLIGFRIGDLRVRKFYKNSETIKVDCGSTRTDQIEHIRQLFEQYGHIWIGKKTPSGRTQIECALDKSFLFLLKKHQVFPKWIIRTKNIFISATAGFIDAEGCFMVSKDNKRSVFMLGNYNTKILQQIGLLLSDLGIKHKIVLGVRKGYTGKEGYTSNSDYWILNINRKMDLEKFCLVIEPYLRYSRKITDLRSVLENIKLRNNLYGLGRTYQI